MTELQVIRQKFLDLLALGVKPSGRHTLIVMKTVKRHYGLDTIRVLAARIP
jgi:hypothetical protein